MVEKIKILVVDDDPLLLDLLLETLSSIGYEAVGAPDAAVALGKLSRTRFSLVITDIKMPGMNGLELSRRIKAEYPGLPVILISGVFSADILKGSDADGILTKPFRIGHVEDMIARTVAHDSESDQKEGNKILVVDDDDGFRLMLTETLKLTGYDVVACSDADQAIRRLDRNGIGTVITDIKMPGMDGLSLARHIKNNRPEIPVILITAFLSPEEQYIDADIADGFLMKPFRVESITDLLESLSDTRTLRSIQPID